MCINAQCLAPVDGGSDVRDVAAVDAPAADAAADVIAQDSGTPDAAVDATIDSGPVVDAQAADVNLEAAVDATPDALACPMGFADCDGMAANGCETDTRTDFNHCGGCGMRCFVGDATPTCTMGHCGLTCGVGQGNCDGMLANGCEVDLQRSRYNCGACGHFCGALSCVMGACR